MRGRWITVLLLLLVGLAGVNLVIAALLHGHASHTREPAEVSIEQLEAGRIPSPYVRLGEHLAVYNYARTASSPDGPKMLYPAMSPGHPERRHATFSRGGEAGPLKTVRLIVVAPHPEDAKELPELETLGPIEGLIALPDTEQMGHVAQITSAPSPFLLIVDKKPPTLPSVPLAVGGLALIAVALFGLVRTISFRAESAEALPPSPALASFAPHSLRVPSGSVGAASLAPRSGASVPAPAPVLSSYAPRSLAPGATSGGPPRSVAPLGPGTSLRPGVTVASLRPGARVMLQRGSRDLVGVLVAVEPRRCRVSFDDGRSVWVPPEEVRLL